MKPFVNRLKYIMTLLYMVESLAIVSTFIEGMEFGLLALSASKVTSTVVAERYTKHANQRKLIRLLACVVLLSILFSTNYTSLIVTPFLLLSLNLAERNIKELLVLWIEFDSRRAFYSKIDILKCIVYVIAFLSLPLIQKSVGRVLAASISVLLLLVVSKSLRSWNQTQTREHLIISQQQMNRYFNYKATGRRFKLRDNIGDVELLIFYVLCDLNMLLLILFAISQERSGSDLYFYLTAYTVGGFISGRYKSAILSSYRLSYILQVLFIFISLYYMLNVTINILYVNCLLFSIVGAMKSLVAMTPEIVLDRNYKTKKSRTKKVLFLSHLFPFLVLLVLYTGVTKYKPIYTLILPVFCMSLISLSRSKRRSKGKDYISYK
jgi:hypothetical protein